MLCSYSTVLKRFKHTPLIIKAPSGAQFAVFPVVPVTEFYRHLVDTYIHLTSQTPIKLLTKASSVVFFRTSFCPMTDDDQHIQETQLKVFVRCKEDTPKQRRRKHSRLNVWPANFNGSKAELWIHEFSKMWHPIDKNGKPRQAPACLQKYNEAGYAVKLSKCDEILGTAKQLSEKQRAAVSINPHLHFCLKSVQTVEHLPIQTLTRQWTLSQWPVAMLSPKNKQFRHLEKPALLHQTSHSNHCTNKYALLFLY